MPLAWHRTEEVGNVAIRGGEPLTVRPHKDASLLRAVVDGPWLLIRRSLFEPRPGSQKWWGLAGSEPLTPFVFFSRAVPVWCQSALARAVPSAGAAVRP